MFGGPVEETYKWIEAASFALDSNDSPELRKNLDEVVRDLIGAQEPSGYLNTYFVEDRAGSVCCRQPRCPDTNSIMAATCYSRPLRITAPQEIAACSMPAFVTLTILS